MNRKNALVRFVLTPFACLYGFAVWFRNQLFEAKVLPSRRYDVPVICVGNLAVGGTGKTPFTEYLIALLKKQYRVAVLSRGYKRRTKGFVWVEADSTPAEAGDEACQVKQKHPDIRVAVDGNRRRGMCRLLSLPLDDRPEVVLLDDAMQHRYVNPSLTIMLTAYENMYFDDAMLPVGNLREPTGGARRADIIIVTKCPDDVRPDEILYGMKKPDEIHLLKKDRRRKPPQRVFLTKIHYHPLVALFPSFALKPCALDEIGEDEELLLLTGIANPQILIDTLKSYHAFVRVYQYPDHHCFTRADIHDIHDGFQKMTPHGRRIITTEKDAMRLKSLAFLPDEWKPVLYYLPMSVQFIFNRHDDFDTSIMAHVVSTININKKHDTN